MVLDKAIFYLVKGDYKHPLLLRHNHSCGYDYCSVYFLATIPIILNVNMNVTRTACYRYYVYDSMTITMTVIDTTLSVTNLTSVIGLIIITITIFYL